jgi:tellurite resistance protein TerC
MIFAIALVPLQGSEDAVDFITGYIIELSLSMDNVFVIALIFAYFRVAAEFQHRVLFWGILGALLMRGVMIGAGIALVDEFQWMFYLLGAFVIFAGVKMLFDKGGAIEPEKNLVIRTARKIFPVATGDHGEKFFVTINGRKLLTSLALVLLMVETTDLIFALDSIPAIFAVTTKPFIVFTSNVFAILGLRSLYFVLAGAIDYFRYLKVGLSVVLILVGAKMLLAPHGGTPHWFQIEIPNAISLVVIAVVLGIAVVASLISKKRGPA